jgi:putative ABC transport system permease protein
MLYVGFEKSYDRFNTNADEIYRVVTDLRTSTGITYENAPAALGPALKEAFPEVKASTRIFLDDYIVQKDDQNYGTTQLAYADTSIFSIFSFPLIKGNPKTVFNAPFDMVISKTAAKKYFGTIDCVGKALILNGNQQATITGVMQDIPTNSHFRTEMILSISSLIGNEANSSWVRNWNRYGFYTYVLLDKNTDVAQLSYKLPEFIKKHSDQSTMRQTLILERLKDVYFKGKPRGGKGGSTVTGNYRNVYIFSLVAVFVLFIASFNFINLSTAFSLYRTKEIGVRKVLGASRKQLIYQLLSDAVLLSIASFIIAILLCILLIPVFNQLSGKTVTTSVFYKPYYIGILFFVTLLIGLFSGIYPALFLSSFQPANTIKGVLSKRPSGGLLRRSLVITQFSISIILIVATAVVYRQVYYMKNHELGFKKDHMLVVDFQYNERILNNYESVKNQLTEIAGIQSVSFASYIPGKPNRKFPTQIQNANGEMETFQSDAYFIDTDFLNQYQVKLIAGRAFSKMFPTDSRQAMIVNESTVKKLGYGSPKDVIGKRFVQATHKGEGVIIGVVRDFHYHSFHDPIQPLTMRISPGFFTFLTLQMSSPNVKATIAKLEQKWSTLAPGLPLSYFFVDETYDAQYKSEERFGGLFFCFTGFAIIISCLGLFGLSALRMVQSTKEIGIRKVLGASFSSLFALLSKEFVLLVFIALIIASPLAWWIMNNWLQDFAYRITISWWIFLLAGSLAIFIALMSVSFQAIKAAIANPVASLRTE